MYTHIYIYIYIACLSLCLSLSLSIYIYICIYTTIYIYIYICICAEARFQQFQHRDHGHREMAAQESDGKLTFLVNLGRSWHEKLTLLVTRFSLPILAYPFQGH